MSIRVLICDDADGLAQLQYALLKFGDVYEIDAVSDGLHAVETAARTQPAAIVAEVGLEGLNGVDLVRRLKAIVPDARIVCWTVLPSASTAAEMLAAGASGYLMKEDGPDAVAGAILPVIDGNVVVGPRITEQISLRFAQVMRQEREMETALADTAGRLEQLTNAKAEFLANVSHELRTPVTVAKGILYVLKHRGIGDEERAEFISKLEGALDKLMTLVDELLTIAELDRGTLSLQLADIDLVPVLRHAVDEMSRRYPTVAIEATIPAQLHAMADHARIAEVVRQLLDNGCRYSSEGDAVQLLARTMAEGVVVSITDHGQGIDREVVIRAFNEPFSTGEEILTKERSGIGLGLHMARQLVLQHSGIIWADPLPAGGTRVSFCLPDSRGARVTSQPTLEGAPSPVEPPAAVA
jgi:signal transduction histidine kinase